MKIDANIAASVFEHASREGTAIASDDMRAIKRWTRDDISAERFFVFPVLAIDTKPTRNHVQYSAESQKASVKSWVGKTFLFNENGTNPSMGGADHALQAASQVGRIYKAQLVKTAQGETGTLVWVYSVRGVSDGVDAFIAKIESGILREVSIHVMVEQVDCSICGVAIQKCEKGHVPGEKYGNETCVLITQGPLEPLELSSVACPGSVNAHVLGDDDAAKLLHLREALALRTIPAASAPQKIRSTETSLDRARRTAGEPRRLPRFASKGL